MARKHTFNVGDKVKHKREFLRSIGWYTNVPRSGTVTAVQGFGDHSLITVEWSEFQNDTPARILSANLAPLKQIEAA